MTTEIRLTEEQIHSWVKAISEEMWDRKYANMKDYDSVLRALMKEYLTAVGVNRRDVKVVVSQTEGIVNRRKKNGR